ncbi:DUF262 domain-containing protein [uncultured Photobacterium sp.]|uniref:DUF262 domain-containing protein n=1 Tax=uncultured Photobacterium sp. TaxID=173973 RepID=UPI002605CC1F|nr:DUF262 domain-containing HNH endonuclease family protein [uncultured Photobacterium sp.]
MNKVIPSFTVKNLLVDASCYLVPMYQRNYAWGEAEINQLIQDVLDYQQKNHNITSKQTYYIGNLVVYERKDGSFEVIDGQQRFTTLTLLAICLRRMALKDNHTIDMAWYQEPNLDFESRKKSTNTFKSLVQGIEIKQLKSEDYNLDVIKGYELIEKGLTALGDRLSDFCDYLFEHVQIVRVSVPQDTDLNHYFEVMNNRGEQLEKHEVVKARLMSVLNDIEDKTTREQSIQLLTKVWDATANMERYVQYGFTPDERHQIFGKDDWGQFTPSNFAELVETIQIEAKEGEASSSATPRSLQDILENPPQSAVVEETTLTPERFNSVINFSNFLLHVLRISIQQDVPLDDKRLLEQFEKHIIKADQAIAAVQAFVFALLKCKYLFDQFIIKREFTQGEDKWSLKRLHYYNSKSQSYINTFDKEREDGFEGDNRRILMLLGALHVSTPTLVYKHWLNGALYCLYNMEEIRPHAYLKKLEHLARQFVFGRFLSPDGAEYYDLIYKGATFAPLAIDKPEVLQLLQYGKIENNLVFNYLDYLLWCEGMSSNNTEDVVKQFEFSFRSSVEHFYPQHPLDGHQQLESQHLHLFGNLCLISHSKNSKLSNVQPAAKRDHFKAAIANKNIDSLKLYEMIKLLNSAADWDIPQIEQHGEEMLKLLEKDSKQ